MVISKCKVSNQYIKSDRLQMKMEMDSGQEMKIDFELNVPKSNSAQFQPLGVSRKRPAAEVARKYL